MPVFVKICGITNPADAEAAIAAGADALGFNFWSGSKRYLEPKKAARWIGGLPDTIVRVAVMVDPTLPYAQEIASTAGIDILQLHGAESPEFCLKLAQAKIRFWKAIPVTGPAFVLHDLGAHRLLLDSAMAGKFGGSGIAFPWNWARDMIATNPEQEFIIAGGLTSQNVAEAIVQTRPFGVDVASGVESRPGRKDIFRLRDFIAAARSV